MLFLCLVIIDEKYVLEETQMVWIWRIFSYNFDDNASRRSHTLICMMFSSIVFAMNILFELRKLSFISETSRVFSKMVQIELENHL